ncbi:hypothetical protein DPM19_09585 [Actinomadura craniellae]|uniref:Uncharacterized protein n=1 Tax=Actinomadura craniellae TaxID=2231787 RepID=A0A365H7L1_9ACTN|nr:hypothetical protein [Actinomadura craniellae]RAY14992.1 hypothetical protein DPM19_09585 [Actinomadura craniellae]
MHQLVTPAQVELDERQRRLLRLRHELARIGVRTRIRRPRNGRWKITLRSARWSETVLCAGAEGAYAYVTVHGRLLGPADDVRHVAQVLVWMVDRKHR